MTSKNNDIKEENHQALLKFLNMHPSTSIEEVVAVSHREGHVAGCLANFIKFYLYRGNK